MLIINQTGGKRFFLIAIYEFSDPPPSVRPEHPGVGKCPVCPGEGICFTSLEVSVGDRTRTRYPLVI